MLEARDFMETGLAFHGHKCPAMPLGLRAAVAAMDALGVERSQDKKLHVVSEKAKATRPAVFSMASWWPRDAPTASRTSRSGITTRWLSRLSTWPASVRCVSP